MLDLIPPGQQVSVERAVFPVLAAAGRLSGFVNRGYWRDIGTPQSYLEAHFDLLQEPLTGGSGPAVRALSVPAGVIVEPGARVVPPFLVDIDVVIGAGAVVGPWAVVGRGAQIGDGARVAASVLQEDVSLGRDAVVERSVVVRRASIGDGTHLSDVIIGEGCGSGRGTIWPTVFICSLWPPSPITASSSSRLAARLPCLPACSRSLKRRSARREPPSPLPGPGKRSTR